LKQDKIHANLIYLIFLGTHTRQTDRQAAELSHTHTSSKASYNGTHTRAQTAVS